MIDEEIEINLLWKFYTHGIWEHSISEDDLLKGFPDHLKYRARLILETLSKKGYLIEHVNKWHMNIKKKNKIENILSKIHTIQT